MGTLCVSFLLPAERQQTSGGLITCHGVTNTRKKYLPNFPLTQVKFPLHYYFSRKLHFKMEVSVAINRSTPSGPRDQGGSLLFQKIRLLPKINLQWDHNIRPPVPPNISLSNHFTDFNAILKEQSVQINFRKIVIFLKENCYGVHRNIISWHITSWTSFEIQTRLCLFLSFMLLACPAAP